MAVATVTRPASVRERHPWLDFLARRLLRLLVSLLVLVTMSFAMLHMVPGDPVRAALGPTASPELVQGRRAELGLDQPLYQQYVDYLRGILSWDFGTSLVSGEPVTDVIGQRLPNTAQLAGLAFLTVVVIALPLGMGAAVLTRNGRRRGGELGFTTVTGILGTIPEFLLAVGLVFSFAVSLEVFPVARKEGPESYVLPVLALAIGPAAVIARIVRVETLKVLGQDYVRTAQSKRLPARLLYLRHVLPNMLTATLTLGGLLLTGMIAGSVLVENVFAWPGLGTTIVERILAKDYAVVQAIVIVLGIAVLVVNLIVDIVLSMLDPRSTIRET